MDAAVWGLIGVVVGGLITGLVTLGAERIKGQNEVMLGTTKRQDDRRLAREAFQRDNLLGVQKAFSDWMQVIFLARMAHKRALHDNRPVVISAEPDATELEADQRLAYLTERVVDDDLRHELTSFRALVYDQQAHIALLIETGALSFQALNVYEDVLVTSSQQLVSHIGPVLRSYL